MVLRQSYVRVVPHFRPFATSSLQRRFESLDDAWAAVRRNLDQSKDQTETARARSTEAVGQEASVHDDHRQLDMEDELPAKGEDEGRQKFREVVEGSLADQDEDKRYFGRSLEGHFDLLQNVSNGAEFDGDSATQRFGEIDKARGLLKNKKSVQVNSRTPGPPNGNGSGGEMTYSELYGRKTRFNTILRNSPPSMNVQRYSPRDAIHKAPPPRDITIEGLLAAQCHLGASTSALHPLCQQFVYGKREGINIINLDLTLAALRRACNVIREVSFKHGIIVMLGNRKAQKQIMIDATTKFNGYYIHRKWLPGTITNAPNVLNRGNYKMVPSPFVHHSQWYQKPKDVMTDEELEEARKDLEFEQRRGASKRKPPGMSYLTKNMEQTAADRERAQQKKVAEREEEQKKKAQGLVEVQKNLESMIAEEGATFAQRKQYRLQLLLQDPSQWVFDSQGVVVPRRHDGLPVLDVVTGLAAPLLKIDYRVDDRGCGIPERYPNGEVMKDKYGYVVYQRRDPKEVQRFLSQLDTGDLGKPFKSALNVQSNVIFPQKFHDGRTDRDRYELDVFLRSRSDGFRNISVFQTGPDNFDYRIVRTRSEDGQKIIAKTLPLSSSDQRFSRRDLKPADGREYHKNGDIEVNGVLFNGHGERYDDVTGDIHFIDGSVLRREENGIFLAHRATSLWPPSLNDTLRSEFEEADVADEEFDSVEAGLRDRRKMNLVDEKREPSGAEILREADEEDNLALEKVMSQFPGLDQMHEALNTDYDLDDEGLMDEKVLEDKPLKPDLLIVLNPKENAVAIREATQGQVPTIGIIDTDANPKWVTYPIPSNDDSLRSVGYIVHALKEAAIEGLQMRRQLIKEEELKKDKKRWQKKMFMKEAQPTIDAMRAEMYRWDPQNAHKEFKIIRADSGETNGTITKWDTGRLSYEWDKLLSDYNLRLNISEDQRKQEKSERGRRVRIGHEPVLEARQKRN